MIKIKETKNRGVLSEGRNNGMAFAFLKKVKDDVYETVQPKSPCKDYLAEVVFTEKYGVPSKGCGLYYKEKLNIFNDKAFMTIKMMPTHRSKVYNYSKSLDSDVQLLKANYPHMVRLLNSFEKKLKLKVLTTIEPANDDQFLVTFSPEWCDSTHSISLYSLLLRVLMPATEKDTDIMSFLKQYKYNRGDVYLVQSVLPKIKLILEKKKLPPNTSSLSKEKVGKFMQSPHGYGICSWRSSFEEVKI